MYSAMCASAPSLHRESTDSLILLQPSTCQNVQEASKVKSEKNAILVAF